MKTKRYKKLLQKSINHTNKQIMRLDQIDAQPELEIAQGLREDLLRRARLNNFKVNEKGMPR